MFARCKHGGIHFKPAMDALDFNRIVESRSVDLRCEWTVDFSGGCPYPTPLESTVGLFDATVAESCVGAKGRTGLKRN